MRYGYEADPRRMSFLDHLAEFRNMAIHCLLILGAGTGAAWFASGVLLDWVIGGLGIEHVQFLSPMEAFNARFKVALIVGLGGTMPLTSLRLWAFVGPAFRAKERRIALPVAVSATVLFAAGTAFSLRVLTPFMLSFLMGFQTDVAQANLALGPLLSFVLRMSLACAVLFQLPLVLGVTTLIGVTTPVMLWAKWRHAVVGIFILSAIVTPGTAPPRSCWGCRWSFCTLCPWAWHG